MIADSFLIQGVKHEICEDYILHGEDYFVLSDGCSNDGVRIDTDFGARLICKAAEKCVDYFSFKLFLKETMTNANIHRMAIGLQADSLSATLFMGCYNSRIHHYFLCGDGFYGGRTRKGEWIINKIEFLPPTPDKKIINFYPSYILNPELLEQYFREEGGRYKITTSIGKFGEGFETTECIDTLDKTAPYIQNIFPSEKYDLSFAASDGLGSFTTLVNKKHTGVDYLKVMEVIFDFPIYGPGLLRHSCNWCFKQSKKGTFPNMGWHNADDVSIGVLYDRPEESPPIL